MALGGQKYHGNFSRPKNDSLRLVNSMSRVPRNAFGTSKYSFSSKSKSISKSKSKPKKLKNVRQKSKKVKKS